MVSNASLICKITWIQTVQCWQPSVRLDYQLGVGYAQLLGPFVGKFSHSNGLIRFYIKGHQFTHPNLLRNIIVWSIIIKNFSSHLWNQHAECCLYCTQTQHEHIIYAAWTPENRMNTSFMNTSFMLHSELYSWTHRWGCWLHKQETSAEVKVYLFFREYLNNNNKNGLHSYNAFPGV